MRGRIFFSLPKFFPPGVLLDPSRMLSKPEAWTLLGQLISFNGRESSFDPVIKWTCASGTHVSARADTCKMHARNASSSEVAIDRIWQLEIRPFGIDCRARSVCCQSVCINRDSISKSPMSCFCIKSNCKY